MTQQLIEGMAAYKVSVNNKTVDKGYFNMNFDGETLDIAGVQKDKLIVMSLDEDDVMNLLAKPSSSNTLMERLSSDFDDDHIMIEEGPILEVLDTKEKKSRSHKKSKKSKKSKKKKKSTSSSKKSRRKTPKSVRAKMLPVSTPVVGPTPSYYKTN